MLRNMDTHTLLDRDKLKLKTFVSEDLVRGLAESEPINALL